MHNWTAFVFNVGFYMDIIWKKIKNFEDYFISNTGIVKKQNILCVKNGKIIVKEGRIITPHKNKDGYLSVTLLKNGLAKGMRINRLVAEAFILNPENKPRVNHLNNIRTDNNANNLQWVTVSENINHAFKNGNKNHKLYNNPNSSFTKEQFDEICEMLSKNISAIQISKITNVNTTAIRRIKKLHINY